MSSPTPTAAERAMAEREALLELIAIFAHDISNPLQSITVLCELGLDEAPPNSEELLRTQQCLQAAQQMRAILQGLGGISQALRGNATLPAIVSRVRAVLSRRLERSDADLVTDLSEVDTLKVNGALEFAIVTACMGFIRSLSRIEITGDKVLSLRARANEPQCHLELSCRSKNTAQIGLPDDYRTRVEAIVRGIEGEFWVDEREVAHIEIVVATP